MGVVCHVPVTIAVRGEVTQGQVDELASRLEGVLRDRLVFAQRELRQRGFLVSRAVSASPRTEEATEPPPYLAALDAYLVPSYAGRGEKVVIKAGRASETGRRVKLEASSPPALSQISEDQLRLLAYATTVLRQLKELSAGEKLQLDTIVAGLDIYELIRRRNAKRAEYDQLRQGIADLQGRARAAASGPLVAGTPPMPGEIELISSQMATLATEVNRLTGVIATRLIEIKVRSEDELVGLIESTFAEIWVKRGKEIAYAMLDQNREIATRERDRYRAIMSSPDIDGLQKADARLLALSRVVRDLKAQIEYDELSLKDYEGRNRAIAALKPGENLSGGAGADPGLLASIRDRIEQARQTLPTALDEFEKQLHLYAREYPILLLREYAPGSFVGASPEKLAELTGGWIQGILDNIDKTRVNIRDDTIRVWDLVDVPELIYRSLGIPKHPILERAVARYIQGKKSNQEMLNTALMVLSLVAGAVAIVATGGVALIAMAAAAGLSAYQLIRETKKYMAESAAERVSIDPLVADISVNEPELIWLVVDALLLALDLGMVLKGLKAAARLAITTGETTIFANTARRLMPRTAAEHMIATAERQAAARLVEKKLAAELGEEAAKAPAAARRTAPPALAPLSTAARAEARLLAAGVKPAAIKAVQAAGVDLVQLSRAGETVRAFVNTFHESTGFAEMMVNWAKGGYSQAGARFIMKYCNSKLAGAVLRFEWPVGIKYTQAGAETWARYVDIVIEGGSKVNPGNTIAAEFKSWSIATLTKNPRRIAFQLIRDRAIFGPGSIRWVFDGAKVTQGQVLDAFVEIVRSDPYLRAAWPVAEEELRSALTAVIEVF